MSYCPAGSERLVPGTASMAAERSSRTPRSADNLAQVTLRLLPLDESYAMLAGTGGPAVGLRWHRQYPLSETLDALAMLVDAYEAEAEPGATTRTPTWWLYQIVLGGDLVVGDVAFHGPPGSDEPAVEIGYAVVESLWRRGIATQAVRRILGVAWEAGGEVVRAETAPGNVGSRQVLLTSGFIEEGGSRFAIECPPGWTRQ